MVGMFESDDWKAYNENLAQGHGWKFGRIRFTYTPE